MVSCYVEGEALFKVGRVAEELKKGVVDKPGWSDWLKRKTAELEEVIEQAKPYLIETEKDRIDNALNELSKLHELAHSRREAATEEIIRTVQLPITVALLQCIQKGR